MSNVRNRMVAVLAVLASCIATGAAQAADGAAAIQPFNGKDLDAWQCKGDVAPDKANWKVGIAKFDPARPGGLAVEPAPEGKGEMVCTGHGRDIYTKQKFGDCTICVEVMVPKGSNSGIYLMGNYEIQVLDSFGRKDVGSGDMGGIYGNTAPKVNASKAPGEWQQFVIEFQAPKFDAAGKKTAKAKIVKAMLNGQVIHENVEIPGCTGGALGKEAATGPLMFQGDHGPIAYRDIKIVPAGAAK
jgi:hypothetical protein